MIRGEIWSVVGGSEYLNKPRPALIIQSDRFLQTDSITVCPLTSDVGLAADFRVRVQATDRNGLESASEAMVDKIITIKRTRLGGHIGHIEVHHLAAVERVVSEFLGIAVR